MKWRSNIWRSHFLYAAMEVINDQRSIALPPTIWSNGGVAAVDLDYGASIPKSQCICCSWCAVRLDVSLDGIKDRLWDFCHLWEDVNFGGLLYYNIKNQLHGRQYVMSHRSRSCRWDTPDGRRDTPVIAHLSKSIIDRHILKAYGSMKYLTL